MIALLDTSEDMAVVQQELGCEVEQLLTPLTRFRRQCPEARFAIDNGAFAGFDEHAFLGLLQREEASRRLCRFVVVPDVVAEAMRTIEMFDYWKNKLPGWPLAFAAQDGQEHLPIPWRRIDAIFIGGSTRWKLSGHAAAIITVAKQYGKWVHAGRVNTPARFEYFERLGADSIDGTGLSRFSHMRERIYAEAIQPNLLTEARA